MRLQTLSTWFDGFYKNGNEAQTLPWSLLLNSASLIHPSNRTRRIFLLLCYYIIWMQHILHFNYPVFSQLPFILHTASSHLSKAQLSPHYYLPPQSNHRKTSHTPNLRDILQSTDQYSSNGHQRNGTTECHRWKMTKATQDLQ